MLFSVFIVSRILFLFLHITTSLVQHEEFRFICDVYSTFYFHYYSILSGVVVVCVLEDLKIEVSTIRGSRKCTLLLRGW